MKPKLLQNRSGLYLIAILTGTMIGTVSAKPKKNKSPKAQKHSRVTWAGKPAGEGKKVRLFILSGQSNMAGLDEKATLIPTIEEAFAEDELIFVKFSKGGQPIRYWYKEWKSADPEFTEEANKLGMHYDKLMKMVKEATKDKELDSVSFMWMQGEKDAKSGQSAVYAESLVGLIKQFRDDLQRQDMTFVIGRINTHLKGEEGWDEVRLAQQKVAEADPKGDWIDLDPLGKGLHYKSDGYKKMGTMFAEKTISLLNKQEEQQGSL